MSKAVTIAGDEDAVDVLCSAGIHLGLAGLSLEVAAVVVFAAAAVAALSGTGFTGGRELGGLAVPSNGLTYTLTGLLDTGALIGGSGAGALGGMPMFVAPPLLIHGQRLVSVRFDGKRLVASSVLFVVALGFSSSLELEADLSAPATVPSGSLTL